VKKTFEDRIGTPDIAAGFKRLGIDAKAVSTSEYAEEIVKRM